MKLHKVVLKEKQNLQCVCVKDKFVAVMKTCIFIKRDFNTGVFL